MLWVKPYFARALAYSELVKLFCKALWKWWRRSQSAGCILTEHYAGDEETKRASLKDSYQGLSLSDPDRAAELLELDEDYKLRLLMVLCPITLLISIEYILYVCARVALYMRKWDEAIKHSSKSNRQWLLVSVSSCTQNISSGESYYKYMWTKSTSTEIHFGKSVLPVNSHGGRLGQIFFNYDYSNYRPDFMCRQHGFSTHMIITTLRVSYFSNHIPLAIVTHLSWPCADKVLGNEAFWKLRYFTSVRRK